LTFILQAFVPAFRFAVMHFDKSSLRTAILAQLQAELALQTRAALLARDEAISEESRAENKYDTHSQEAAYLAEGQARQALEIEGHLAAYSALPLPSFGATDAIGIGAVIELESGEGENTLYFLGPRAGGLETTVGGKKVLVITPQSPIGRELMGRRVGDSMRGPGRPGRLQRIASVA
jgi:transcription elongation GreA/GreB family factor